MKLRAAFSALTVAWLAIATLVYTFYSIDTVLRFAPHALYADQWRQYVEYVTLPFPTNVFRPDNGHRSVLPNVIAWLEIIWFDGNQWLQIAVGLCCGFAAAAMAAALFQRDSDVPRHYRAAAAFLCFFAIFWLANVRTLFHSTELLHTKLPMFCLVAAVALGMRAARTQHPLPALLASLVLALLATFSFGYGLAVFVGVFAALVACKAERKLLAACAAALGVATAMYLLLPGSDGVRGSVTFAPLENLLVAARWLGAPFMTMFTFLWDPNIARMLPDFLQEDGIRLARFSAIHLPDFHTSVMPQALFGGLGMIALIVASHARLRASEPARPTEALGLGIAWYGLSAAGIVSLSRLTYFHEHPEQIYAERYLCWPCLFWLGLGLVALSRQSGTGTARARPALIAQFAFASLLVFTLCAWPTQKAGRIYATLVRGHVDNMAVGGMVRVFPRDAGTGETVREEFVRGVPILARHRIAQFADPAADEIGRKIDAPAGVADAILEAHAVPDNLLGQPGTAVSLHFARDTGVRSVLLVDRGDRVVGAAVDDTRLDPPGLSGYARGVFSAEDLRAVAVP